MDNRWEEVENDYKNIKKINEKIWKYVLEE